MINITYLLYEETNSICRGWRVYVCVFIMAADVNYFLLGIVTKKKSDVCVVTKKVRRVAISDS